MKFTILSFFFLFHVFFPVSSAHSGDIAGINELPSKGEVYLKIVSDLHLEHYSSLAAAEASVPAISELLGTPLVQPDDANTRVLALCGDIGQPYGPEGGNRTFEKFLSVASKHYHHVLYIPGNHDVCDTRTETSHFASWKEAELKLQEICTRHHVTYLNNQAVQIGNNIFVGSTLWSQVDERNPPKIIDYKEIHGEDQKGIGPAGTNKLHAESVGYISSVINLVDQHNKTLADQPSKQKSIVMLTHHAPLINSVDGCDVNVMFNQEPSVSDYPAVVLKEECKINLMSKVPTKKEECPSLVFNSEKNLLEQYSFATGSNRVLSDRWRKKSDAAEVTAKLQCYLDMSGEVTLSKDECKYVEQRGVRVSSSLKYLLHLSHDKVVELDKREDLDTLIMRRPPSAEDAQVWTKRFPTSLCRGISALAGRKIKIKKGTPTGNPEFIGSESSTAFQSDMSSEMRGPVKLWAFGHTHFSTNFEYNGVQVVANQVGYGATNSEATGCNVILSKTKPVLVGDYPILYKSGDKLRVFPVSGSDIGVEDGEGVLLKNSSEILSNLPRNKEFSGNIELFPKEFCDQIGPLTRDVFNRFDPSMEIRLGK